MENDKMKFFIEDEVAMVSPKSGLVKYGMISDIEEKNPNKIKVTWHPVMNEQKMLSNEVVLMERNIQIREVFRKVGNKQSQLGFCENVNVYATVKILNTNKIIENIDCRSLTSMKPPAPLKTVVYKSRFGEIHNTKCEITFVSIDGSIFTLVYPYVPQGEHEFTFGKVNLRVFYPGRKLKLRLAFIEKAKFINMTNTMRSLLNKCKIKHSLKRIKVYVKDINVASIEVRWFNPNENGKKRTVFYGDDLKEVRTLDFFDSHPAGLSEINWYTIKKNDYLIPMKQWRSKCTENFISGISTLPDEIKKDGHHGKILRINKNKMSDKLLSRNSQTYKIKSFKLKRTRTGKSFIKKQIWLPKVYTKSNSKVKVKICFIKSMIDVIWQDGTKESGVPSTELYPALDVNEHEFFPCDLVKENNSNNMYGVVQSVNHEERTAHVQWFDVDPEFPLLPIPKENTQSSVYDLIHHEKMEDLSLGSYVKSIIRSDMDPDLSAGQIINRGIDGRVLVKLVNGEEIRCWPQELHVIHITNNTYCQIDKLIKETKHSIAVATASLSECWQKLSNLSDPEKALVKEAQNLFNMLSLEQMDMFMEKSNEFMLFEKLSEFNGSEPNEDGGQTEIDFINDFIQETKESFNVRDEDTNKEIKELVVLNGLKQMMVAKVNSKKGQTKINEGERKNEAQRENNDLKLNNDDNYLVELPETIPLESPSAPNINPIEHKVDFVDIDKEPQCEDISKPKEAGVFEMVETLDSLHIFTDQIFGVNPKMLKTVTKEIQILQKSLPAGIWAKTFENRMDLFSIMIRGPEKTPYAGGLFIFDVKLPNTYPLVPPLCHYYSFCDGKLNPNLYENGKVCLSLLGTWYSDNNMERWSPNHSNLLQLLVSIQGLILVSEPYFNEPGLALLAGLDLAKDDSRFYNEMAVIKVIQSMTNMLKMIENINFKTEIIKHVTTHGPKLISTIENWIAISERELSEDEKLDDPGFPLFPLTKGFCLSAKKALEDFKNVLNSLNITLE